MFLNAIHQRATRDPKGIAAVTEDRRVPNDVLWDEMTSLAAWLLRQGLAPGDTIGISIRHEYRHLLASLAAIHAGLPHITLPTHDPVEARTAIARRVRARAILVDDPRNALPDFVSLLPDFEYRATADDPGWDFARRASSDVCLFLASSGTTGRAKIIPLTEAQLFHQAMTAQLVLSRSILYRPASIEFNNSKRHRLYCAASGGTNVFYRSAPAEVAEICRRFGVTHLLVSVAQTKRLLDLPADDARLPPYTEIQVRGSVVAAETRDAIRAHITPRLAVGYGASEFGSITTAGVEEFARHPSTVGKLHLGVDLEIVDDADRPVGPEVSGRIRVRSAGMATRYHDDDQATAAAFRDGWFYPGDVGHLSDAGDLRFDGRTDDMMVLTSINIFPAEIERVAQALPGVIDCAAFSVKSGEFGDVPLLAVVSNGSTTPAEVLIGVRNTLGMRAPRRVFFVETLPRNAEGKILRTELRRLLEERPEPKAVA